MLIFVCRISFHHFISTFITFINSFQLAPVKVTLDDIDDLIGALSPEELKELSSVDPDVSSCSNLDIHFSLFLICYKSISL